MVLNEVEKQLVYEKLEKQLPDLIKKAEHSELYGYDLNALLEDDGDGKTIKERFLRKFLAANDYKLEESKTQLLNTLKWRKEFCPLSAAFKEDHNKTLNETAFVTCSESGSTKKTQVTTWNLYGAVKDRHQIFGDLDAFLRWRIGLMEQGLALLDFTNEDSSYMTQVHDYFNVSFLRIDSETKSATSETIKTFQSYYPEALDKKYFVNVPRIMSWMFTLFKTIIPKATTEKFVVLDDGSKLAAKLGDWVPKASYGGKGENLSEQQVSDVKPRDESLVEKQYQHYSDSKKGAKKDGDDQATLANEDAAHPETAPSAEDKDPKANPSQEAQQKASEQSQDDTENSTTTTTAAAVTASEETESSEPTIKA